MTRKDYVAIAAAVRDSLEHQAITIDYREGWNAAASSIAHRLADTLALGNERFDRERFLRACGVQS